MNERMAPGATIALIFGILGCVIFPIVFAPLAIWYGWMARKAIKEDPELHGGGRAAAGQVLGIVGIVLFIGILVLLVTV